MGVMLIIVVFETLTCNCGETVRLKENLKIPSCLALHSGPRLANNRNEHCFFFQLGNLLKNKLLKVFVICKYRAQAGEFTGVAPTVLTLHETVPSKYLMRA